MGLHRCRFIVVGVVVVVVVVVWGVVAIIVVGLFVLCRCGRSLGTRLGSRHFRTAEYSTICNGSCEIDGLPRD